MHSTLVVLYLPANGASHNVSDSTTHPLDALVWCRLDVWQEVAEIWGYGSCCTVVDSQDSRISVKVDLSWSMGVTCKGNGRLHDTEHSDEVDATVLV